MKTKEILKTIKAKKVFGTLPFHVFGITADTSKVRRGYAFIAIKGLNSDGHDLIKTAKAAGAILVIIDREVEPILPTITVEDTRAIWGPLVLASKGNPQESIKLIGVTGTNGKTTVSTLIHQILSKLGYKAGLMGTIATKICDETIQSKLTTGDPEHISEHLYQMKNAGCTVAVMEVSSHALSQGRVNGLNFDVAIFTNLTQDHLDYHGTMDSYAMAKKMLFDALNSEAIAIVNTDDEWHQRMIADCTATVWGYGVKDDSLFIHNTDTTGSRFELNETIVETKLSGTFNVYNASAAYLACLAIGCSEKNVTQAISEAEGAAGRLERVTYSADSPAVFVDYAHTPDALENVLKSLQSVRENASLVVVFGCGGDRDRSKRPLMGAVSVSLADKVYLTSDNPRSESPNTIINEIASGISVDFADRVNKIEDRREAIKKAIFEASDSDVILIAGKGHETYQEINGERFPMDDREIAAQALEIRNHHVTMQGGE